MATAKPVQISFNKELLKQVDREPIVKKRGRSAFVQELIETYFKQKKRREIDESIIRAYAGKADELEKEFAPFRKVQAWPEDWD